MDDQAGAATRADRLAAEIADAILRGELPPGSRLDEHGLASRYDVSRTPVREALRQLGASGLIELAPRRGAVVACPTREQLEDLFVAMGEMEATCARLSAIGMSPLERRRLQSLHDRMGGEAEQGAEEAYADLNVAFHEAIAMGARNRVLADIAAGLRRRLAPYRRAQFRAPGRLVRSHAEHAAIVTAILRGDATGAHAVMLHHVDLVEDAFEEVASNPRGQGRSDDGTRAMPLRLGVRRGS